VIYPLPPLGSAQDELGWFFSVDDGRRVKPHFDRTSGRHLAGLLGVPEHEVCQEAVHRRIRRWVVAVGDHDAAVLQALCGPRAWPRALRDALGGLTGVVVRLACAVEWPDETWEQDLLEMRVATRLDAVLAARGRAGLAAFRTAAGGLVHEALAAYFVVRGRAPGVAGGRS
jgi:hypothetical protein